MSWLSTAWNVGVDLSIMSNLIGIRQGISANQSSNAELNEELKIVAVAMAASTAYVECLKEQIFLLRQAAEEFAHLEFTDLKQEAIIYHLLCRLLQQSPIDVTLFTELSDKDYVSATSRMLRVRRRMIKKQCSEQMWSEVETIVEGLLRMTKHEANRELHSILKDTEVVAFIPLTITYSQQPAFVQAGMATVRCTKCQTRNAANLWLCDNCGKPLLNERRKVVPQTATESQPGPGIPAIFKAAPQPTPESGSNWITCRKCGTDNPKSSFLCANCSNRLK